MTTTASLAPLPLVEYPGFWLGVESELTWPPLVEAFETVSNNPVTDSQLWLPPYLACAKSVSAEIVSTVAKNTIDYVLGAYIIKLNYYSKYLSISE